MRPITNLQFPPLTAAAPTLELLFNTQKLPAWTSSDVKADEIVVGRAVTLEDEAVGRASACAALRVAVKHRAGLQRQRVGAGFLRTPPMQFRP